MRRSFLVQCVVVLSLAGCGGSAPKLDTSTDASMDASITAMTAGMSDVEKARFQEDCQICAVGEMFADAPPKGNAAKDGFGALNGLTADQIRTKASDMRKKLVR